MSQSDHLYEGKTATVAGWGITEDGETSQNELRKVDVPIISNTQCKGFYSWIRRYRFFKLHIINFNLTHLHKVFTCVLIKMGLVIVEGTQEVPSLSQTATIRGEISNCQTKLMHKQSL